mmetsp:Transcript_13356/g.28057  ORF Transcript_13356/g.28057 Transcript_13356/m.28057 type:complete len:539 (-) Transcript_13356:75-1691(-)
MNRGNGLQFPQIPNLNGGGRRRRGGGNVISVFGEGYAVYGLLVVALQRARQRLGFQIPNEYRSFVGSRRVNQSIRMQRPRRINVLLLFSLSSQFEHRLQRAPLAAGQSIFDQGDLSISSRDDHPHGLVVGRRMNHRGHHRRRIEIPLRQQGRLVSPRGKGMQADRALVASRDHRHERRRIVVVFSPDDGAGDGGDQPGTFRQGREDDPPPDVVHDGLPVPPPADDVFLLPRLLPLGGSGGDVGQTEHAGVGAALVQIRLSELAPSRSNERAVLSESLVRFLVPFGLRLAEFGKRLPRGDHGVGVLARVGLRVRGGRRLGSFGRGFAFAFDFGFAFDLRVSFDVPFRGPLARAAPAPPLSRTSLQGPPRLVPLPRHPGHDPHGRVVLIERARQLPPRLFQRLAGVVQFQQDRVEFFAEEGQEGGERGGSGGFGGEGGRRRRRGGGRGGIGGRGQVDELALVQRATGTIVAAAAVVEGVDASVFGELGQEEFAGADVAGGGDHRVGDRGQTGQSAGVHLAGVGLRHDAALIITWKGGVCR